MLFPKETLSNLKGMSGQAYFQFIVNNYLECIYHPIHQESDFGIDGYIEIVRNSNVTGKFIGVQIKHGDFYFNNLTKYGYKYIGEQKHLNYYLNNRSPVYIIIIDDNYKRMNWVRFDINKTMPIGNQKWWIEIPKENEVKSNFKQEIFEQTDTVIDFEEQIQVNWMVNTTIKETDRKILAISKSEIEKSNFEFIKDYIDRMSINKEIIINSRTSMDIFFPEYDYDKREIIQVVEIMNWLKKSIDIGIPWFYFADYRQDNVCLKLLVHSYCKSKLVYRTQTQLIYDYDKSDLEIFLYKNFDNMNQFMNKYHIDKRINKEITDGIINFYFKK